MAYHRDPRPRRAHRAHLQHLRAADAARGRPGRVELPRAGARGQAAHDLRRRHARPAASATSTTRSAASSPCSTPTTPGPINIGNPGEFTMLELAELVLEVTGSTSRDRATSRCRSTTPTQRQPDITLARDAARLGADDRAARGPRPRTARVLPRPLGSSAGLTAVRPRARGRAQIGRGPRPRSRWARYQSRVRRRPSSKGVRGLEAELASRPGRRRRGGGAGRRAWTCPSGPRPRSRRARR